jgi:Tfp pilus assembly protein PilO
MDGTASELAALRDERDLVRSRVSDMLRQLDHLNV